MHTAHGHGRFPRQRRHQDTTVITTQVPARLRRALKRLAISSGIRVFVLIEEALREKLAQARHEPIPVDTRGPIAWNRSPRRQTRVGPRA